MRLRVLILDFDGVILESNEIKTGAFRQVCSGYPAHLDAMMRYHERNVSLSRYVKFNYLVSTLLQRPGDTASRPYGHQGSTRATNLRSSPLISAHRKPSF